MAHPRRRADHIHGTAADTRPHASIPMYGLDRVGVRVLDPADHLQRARLHLEGLALGRRRHSVLMTCTMYQRVVYRYKSDRRMIVSFGDEWLRAFFVEDRQSR